MDAYYKMLSRKRDLEKAAFVEDGRGAISYVALFREADALGRRLVDWLGEYSEPVGVFQAKSLEAVVSIYGVLAAVKAFVPIDPGLPESRISHIVTSAQIRLVICDGDISDNHRRLFEELGVALVVCSFVAEKRVYALEGSPKRVAEKPVSQRPLSHILFTSGTTGEPKGVMIARDSQIAFTECMAEAFGHDESTRWLSLAPLYFDVCTMDLFIEAYCGSTVFLMPPRLPAFAIAEAFERLAITHGLLISSVVKMLASDHSCVESRDLSHMRELWYGGEACPVAALRRLKSLFPHLTFAQCYGPSEVCNNATLHRFSDIPPEVTGYMPLGGPIRTVEARLVDDYGRVVDGAGLGELYLGGIQVMAGYVNDLAGTAKAIVADPAGKSAQPFYRTGDYVTRDEAGLLHFHGRRDELVKVRGNRVSLHEVQAAVNALPGVLDSIIFVGRGDIGGVLDSLNAIVVSAPVIDRDGVRAKLRQALPSFMVPDRFFFEDGAVPTKENGKLDRESLLRRFQSGGSAGQ